MAPKIFLSPCLKTATERGREANSRKACDNKKHSGRQTNDVEDPREGNSCGMENPAFDFVVTENNEEYFCGYHLQVSL